MKKSCRITYVGSFPPPYGGVTVKNALLYKHLSTRLKIERIDLSCVKRLELRAVCHLVRCILSRRGALVLGVSANWRYRLTSILYCFNREKMRHSLLVVMGGRVPESMSYAVRMGGYRRVYVETESMRRSFETMGTRNVEIYPNCRERPVVPVEIKSSEGRMSCVFFSLISPDKGTRIVLGAARELPQVDFHFYGRIEKGYEAEFFSTVAVSPNVCYHGVFDSVTKDAVGELNKYDVHLFPTLCPNEGVPGVIVETKMAGVPTIASDRSYNGELIEDGVDGILTHEDTSAELAAILGALSTDIVRVDRMKAAAFESAGRYEIEMYLDRIIDDLIESKE